MTLGDAVQSAAIGLASGVAAIAVYTRGPAVTSGLLDRLLDWRAKSSRRSSEQRLVQLQKELSTLEREIAHPEIILGRLISSTAIMIFALSLSFPFLSPQTFSELWSKFHVTIGSDLIILGILAFFAGTFLILGMVATLIGYPDYSLRKARYQDSISKLKSRLGQDQTQ